MSPNREAGPPSFSPDYQMLAHAGAEIPDPAGIYWVIGGAGAGKSTVCQEISSRQGIPVYDMDQHIYGSYMGRYTWERHPASLAWFSAENSLEWVLSLSLEAFDNLNRAANVEYLDLLSVDLVNSPRPRPLLVDGGITHPSILARVLPPEQILCLEITSEESAQAWGHDPDRADMKKAIQGLARPVAAWQVFLERDRLITETINDESKELGIRLVRRNSDTSVSELTSMVLKHFAL